LAAGAEQALLRVQDVAVRFGGIVALDGVSFDVPAGRIVGLIGPNGAGKTTLFNCISRLYPCERGDIAFAGRSLLGVPRHRIAALGIGRTFQNLALFRTMSVLENVMVGRHSRSRGGFFSAAVRLPYAVRADAEARGKARELLALLDLERFADTSVAALPFGTQKRVELARALAAQPKLLLLDEPASGLNHEEVAISVQDRGIGIDKSDLFHIFEPFYRSPVVRAAQIHGTGLGLPLAKSIAEAMGGKLTVESNPGVGSTFTLHLPGARETIRPATGRGSERNVVGCLRRRRRKAAAFVRSYAEQSSDLGERSCRLAFAITEAQGRSG